MGIGHVFRKHNPYVVHVEQVVKNTKRAALVWLDGWIEKYYQSQPVARFMEVGDVSDRVALRQKLKCNSMVGISRTSTPSSSQSSRVRGERKVWCEEGED